MIVRAKSRRIRFTAGIFAIFLALLFSVSLPVKVLANEHLELTIIEIPPQPQPVSDVLEDLLTDTLDAVLIDSDNSVDLRQSDPAEVAEAIRTGINIVIEPKGYNISSLVLELDASPIKADFTVTPIGWSEIDPRAVTGVVLELDPGNLDAFWLERISERLRNGPDELAVYKEYLLGLPTHAVDRDWALQIVMPFIYGEDPVQTTLPAYTVSYDITIDDTAVVILTFEPKDDVIERIRPRMYSMTLLNVFLDRFRETLLVEADFIEGIPVSEIGPASEGIAARLAAAIESDILAKDLNAYASVQIQVLENENVLLVDVLVESRTYDIILEAYMDFGDESSDSSEIDGRLGYLLSRGVEVFINLNYFTNDSTLETDIALGMRPQRGSFFGIGYDIDREFWKYFIKQELYPGLEIRAEVFEDDNLNEFGMIYQFQQYFAAGAFTNGDNEFWARAIFAL